MKNVVVIDLYPPMARCCICGKWDISKWGVPVSTDTGLIISNQSAEDWAGKPACEKCWAKHESGEFVGYEPKW